MKKIIIISALLICTSFACYSQCQTILALLHPALTVPPPNDSNYIDICIGNPITFAAKGSGAAFPQSGLNYTQDSTNCLYLWDFGDGTTATGQIITHTYTLVRGYDVQLTITDSMGCTNSNNLGTKIRISQSPYAAINPLVDMCSGSDTAYVTIGYNPASTIVLDPVAFNGSQQLLASQQFDSTMFIPDGPSCPIQCYNTYVTFTAFSPGAIITNGNDILSICVNMEHSFAGDLGFRIICPNGQSVQLDPNTHSGGEYMGEPYGGSSHGSYDSGCDPANNTPGTGWTYCWSQVYPQHGTLDALASGGVSPIDSTNTINNTNYITPNTALTGLIGCPLNGTWNIEICDDYGQDNGYIFWWELNLDPSLLPAGWAYSVPIDTVIWNGSFINNINDSTIMVTPDSGGTYAYTVTVYDVFGCSYDTTLSLQVIQTPEVDLGPDTSICTNSFISLDAGNPGSGHYEWSTGDTTQAIYTSQAGFYSVTVTNTNGNNMFSCSDSSDIQINIEGGTAPPLPAVTGAFRCNPGSVTLSASGGTSYIWYNALAGGNVVNTGPIFNTPTLNTTTTYYVSNYNGCESMRVPVIAQINNIAVDAGTDKNITCGNGVTLNTNTVYSGTNLLTYSWSPNTGLSSVSEEDPFANPTQTTNYTIMVTDGLCTSYDEVTVNVTPISISLNFNANPQTLTSPPFNVQFDNLSPNMSNYNYTWHFGDGTSLQSNNLSVNHQYAQNGIYDVSLEASSITNGCTDMLIAYDLISCSGGTVCQHTATIVQNNPVTACLGSSAALWCNIVAGASYQWNYNGISIPNSNNNYYFAYDPGNYNVTITLDSCAITSEYITVIFNNPPPIPAITTSGNMLYCTGGSVTLNAPAGANSYLWSNNETTQNIIVTTPGLYTVQITDINGCSSQSDPFIVGASPLGNPDICIVGVDSVSGKNVVVWNKPITNAIDHFNIYSEGSQTNILNLIGSVPYNNISMFTDNNSFPGQQAYLYKITVVDTCNAETNLSASHRTIHLNINQGMGLTYNLIWNYYEGFTFSSYNIYRGNSPSNLTLLATIASSLNSYTDLTPPLGYVYYQIEAVNPTPCNPSKTTYYSSRSNIASNNTANVENFLLEEMDIKIYPNPANNYIFIEIPVISSNKPSDLKIYSIDGKLILDQLLVNMVTSVNVGSLSTGIYFIRLENSEGFLVRKFVKE